MGEINSEWYSAVLEEYKSLRSEAVTARDAQLSTLRLSVPLLAALIGIGVSLSNGTETLLGGLVLSVGVPIIVILTFEMLIGEIQRSVRAGAVVAAIEKRIGEMFEVKEPALGPPMGWEQWLRRTVPAVWPSKRETSQQKKDSMIRAWVISLFLFLVGLGSCALGVHFLWHYDHRVAMEITVAGVAISSGLFAVRVRYALRGVNDRHEAPEVAEVWPADADWTKSR